MSRRRVGLLGGTFDPIHTAHLEIARRARDQLALDAVWLVPADRPPHKTDQVLTETRHRLAMVRLAIAGEERLDVCTLETDDPGVHATVDTVAELSRLHPGWRFVLVLGEDGFRALDTWVRPGELARRCEFAVAGRRGGGSDRPKRAFGARVHWLEGPRLDVSATQLRVQLGRGEAVPEVPAPVLEYIRAHGLYRGGDRP